MKNKCIIALLLFLFTTLGSYAQTSNNEQRLVGTWVTEGNEETWIFNSAGSGTWRWGTTRYGAAGNRIAIYWGGDTSILEYYLSTDGRTLILYYLDGSGGRLLRKRP